MSGSVSTNASSKISQFGLYRTIDSRTEEFLKLSKKRQIRQGCACAAVSTAITVTIVVVILLIYEYTITVESSNLVQRRKGLIRKLNGTVLINDTPVADRLDRSYFGFDQDYFEQMPLLVNAMQENSYVDPIIDIPMPSNSRGRLIKTFNITTPTPVSPPQSHRPIAIRRTSPRPFIFEYRSPTPVPFHKNYNSRSWVESYRNAQRLKNLEQVINYLEKTIHAKFGDLYTLPSNTQIGFSGVYMQPAFIDNKHETTTKADLVPQSSNTVQTFKKENHQSDPYFSFKPERPGDVNLLADGPYRFSFVPTPSIVSKATSNIPMFRAINRLKGCTGTKCRTQNIENKALMKASSEINSSEASLPEKPKSFSVMLNVFPITSTPPTYYKKHDTYNALDKIYITTSRPQFQLRRKSTGSIPRRRSFVPKSKRPKKLSENKTDSFVVFNSKSSEDVSDAAKNTKMVLHVNIFPKSENETTTTTATTTTSTAETPKTSVVNTPYIPTCPPLCSVEDYHVGSSGIIPIEQRTFSPTTNLPKVTTTIPFFENSEENKSWPTTPPEILKFSQEDAKIPEQYQRLRESEESHQYIQINANRRNSREDFDDTEQHTLIIKLRNYLETTTPLITQNVIEENITEADVVKENISSEKNKEEINQQTTTIQTYVPQINGHYRSLDQNSRQINDWFDSSSEEDRKRRLEIKTMNVASSKPKYVEIRRDRSASVNEKLEE